MSTTRINILMCTIIFLFAMAVTVLSPLLIEISKSFDLSMGEAGIVFTSYFAGFVVFVFAGGFFTNHLKKKAVLLFSLAGFALFLGAATVAANYLLFCISMFFVGGFGGIIETVSTAMISEINDANKSFYLNVSAAAFGIGAVLGPICAALLIQFHIQWQFYFVILAAMTLLIFILLLISKIPHTSNGEVQRFDLSELKSLFSDSKFLLICLCMFLYTGSEIGAWGWMSTFLEQDSSFSILELAGVVAVFWGAMTIGRAISAKLTLHTSSGSIILGLSLLSVVAIISSLLFQSGFILWILTVVMGLGFSGIWPTVVAYGGEHRKSSSGLTFSLLVGFGGVGGTVIPLIMGYVGEFAGTRAAMLLAAVFLFIISLVFFVFGTQKAPEKAV